MDFVTYQSLIDRTIYSIAPPGSGPGQAKAAAKRIPRGRKRVAYLHLLIGLFFLGVYALHGGSGDFSRIISAEFADWSWRWKFAFVQLAGLVARTKYYGVWSLSEVRPENQSAVPMTHSRAHAFSQGLASTATIQRLAAHSGTACATLTLELSRRRRVSRSCWILGIVGRM